MIDQLLEQAAWALGCKALNGKVYGLAGHHGPRSPSDLLCDNDLYWNPLVDDGDALRLAAALALPIEFRDPGFGYDKTPENRRVMCGRYWDSNESRYCMFGELVGKDLQRATRWVIVKAAAECGRTAQQLTP